MNDKLFNFVEALQDVISERDGELYEHQSDYLRNLCDHLIDGNTMALGVMPTGAGKTRTYAMIAEAAQRAELKIAIYAPKIELTRQNVDSIVNVIPSLTRDDFAEIHSDAPKRAGDEFAHSITYANTLAGLRGSDNAANYEDYDLVIFDEAQYLLGDKLWREATKLNFENSDTIAIAATATPKRNDEQDLTALFGEPFYEMSLREAIELGILAGAEAYYVNVDIDLGIDKAKGKDGEYSKAQLKAIDNEAFNRVAIEIYLQDVANAMAAGQPIPTAKVFAGSVAHSETLAKQFTETFAELGLPLKADYMAGKRSREKKALDENGQKIGKNRQILNAANDGELNVVISNKIAIEGLDVKRIGTVIKMVPMGPVEATQSLGRGLRKFDLAAVPTTMALSGADVSPQLRLAGLLQATEEQVVKGYDLYPKGVEPSGTLVSDLIGGSIIYPKHRKKPSEGSSGGESEPIQVDLPEFEVTSNIEKVNELRRLHALGNEEKSLYSIPHQQFIEQLGCANANQYCNSVLKKLSQEEKEELNAFSIIVRSHYKYWKPDVINWVQEKHPEFFERASSVSNKDSFSLPNKQFLEQIGLRNNSQYHKKIFGKLSTQDKDTIGKFVIGGNAGKLWKPSVVDWLEEHHPKLLNDIKKDSDPRFNGSQKDMLKQVGVKTSADFGSKVVAKLTAEEKAVVDNFSVGSGAHKRWDMNFIPWLEQNHPELLYKPIDKSTFSMSHAQLVKQLGCKSNVQYGSEVLQMLTTSEKSVFEGFSDGNASAKRWSPDAVAWLETNRPDVLSKVSDLNNYEKFSLTNKEFAQLLGFKDVKEYGVKVQQRLSREEKEQLREFSVGHTKVRWTPDAIEWLASNLPQKVPELMLLRQESLTRE